MFGTDWTLSGRIYEPIFEKSLDIPLAGGNHLNASVTRPDAEGEFPVILCVHAYAKEDQYAPLDPNAFSFQRGHMEAGSSEFWARRGYVHVVVNVPGTGASSGRFDNLGRGTIAAICEAIEWLSSQHWSNGRVGMFGISYFGLIQPLVAMHSPKGLAALFAPYGYTDIYRDRYYHGGILNHRFVESWLPTLDNPRAKSALRESIDQEAYEELLQHAKTDPELAAVPYLQKVLQEHDADRNAPLIDALLQPLDGPYYRERSVDYDQGCTIPAYFGACWGVFGLHLPGALRSFENWRGPKRLTIGPPVYLDRPFYQYHLEALRWFDHWLKDNDTGMMDEPSVNLFVVGTGKWKSAHQWPLPETRFTRFYLHENNALAEREYLAAEGSTSFNDSPYERGKAEFWSYPLVEETEIAGPMALELHAKTTGSEVLWFITILCRDLNGEDRILTRGWLRGSQRATLPERSRPWQPHHAHTAREPLTPSSAYKFDIEIRPYAISLKPGEKLGLRISCSDNETPPDPLQAISMGHLARQDSSRVTVLHDTDHPSNLIVPIVSGNRIGTFVSGGKL